jgi:hypothetical protein
MPSTGVPTTRHPSIQVSGPITTIREVLEGTDLTGKVAIVTGGYAGTVFAWRWRVPSASTLSFRKMAMHMKKAQGNAWAPIRR